MLSVLCHLLNSCRPARLGTAGFAGILIFALNFPVGWGGAAVCGILAATDSARRGLWGSAAGGFYALSWVMLIGGVALAGKPVIESFKKRLPMAFRARRRQRRMAGLSNKKKSASEGCGGEDIGISKEN